MEYVHSLSWSPKTVTPSALPYEIDRIFLQSPGGPLELLVSTPTGSSEAKPPLLFVHGGFGSAACFSNYLTFFSARGYHCYSISLRGHGASYYPGYWAMYWTSKQSMCSDLTFAVSHIHRQHDKPVILVGHSSGGGISQYLLSNDLEKAGGLVALAPTPGFGVYSTSWNWMKLDPWCVARFYFHLGHSRSLLSSTKLIRQAYFSDSYPTEAVREFERNMPEYESMGWSYGLMVRFADPAKVIANIVPTLPRGRRILVVGGSEDRIMTARIMEKLVAWYRSAWNSVAGRAEPAEEVAIFEEVEGSGHYLMREAVWEKGAEIVLEWLEG